MVLHGGMSTFRRVAHGAPPEFLPLIMSSSTSQRPALVPGQGAFGLSGRYDVPRILERERYTNDHVRELALGHGFHWAGGAWLEVSTLFTVPDRQHSPLEEAAGVRLEAELLGWEARKLPLPAAGPHDGTMSELSVELLGVTVMVPIVRLGGFAAAVHQLGDGRRVILCWTTPLFEPHNPLVLSECTSLDDYRKGLEADESRRLH